MCVLHNPGLRCKVLTIIYVALRVSDRGYLCDRSLLPISSLVHIGIHFIWIRVRNGRQSTLLCVDCLRCSERTYAAIVIASPISSVRSALVAIVTTANIRGDLLQVLGLVAALQCFAW